MNVLEREKERQARRKTVQKWPKRLEALAARKADPLSERAFCLKHEIPVFSFNRTKKLHCEPLKRTVDRVEEAFKAEGV